MKKIPFYLFALYLGGTCFLSSCRTSCTCSMNLGCKIMTAEPYMSGQPGETKMFCSEFNFYTDPVFLDSVSAFYARHKGVSVNERDSIYYTDSKRSLKTKETQYYENLGYQCVCFK